MNEINLAAILAAKRRGKGITQDELASYMGVSKASVSKWETGQSYPDITFLPLLAAYFDISIDELMGYSPQLSKADIAKLYQKLAADFAVMPFEDVIADCEAVIRKYFSCYPLLLFMVQLYINHCPMAATQARRDELLHSAAGLCERIKTGSKDAQLVREAVFFQSVCLLSLRNAEAVLELLGDGLRPMLQEGTLISQAYMVLGNAAKAKETLQVVLYQNLMSVFNGLIAILQANIGNIAVGEEVFSRAEKLAELFHMRGLNPNNMAMLYALGAQMYCAGGYADKAIELLDRYADTCIHGFFPLALHGDDFFDGIDGWLAEVVTVAPRSEKTVKESMIKDVLLNPVFDCLHAYPGYGRVIQKLRNFVGGN